jgi:hypothetical protein
MITLIPAENESPAFCILKGKLLVPVTYYLFQNVLRKLIKEIGEDSFILIATEILSFKMNFKYVLCIIAAPIAV